MEMGHLWGSSYIGRSQGTGPSLSIGWHFNGLFSGWERTVDSKATQNNVYFDKIYSKE